MPLQKNNFTIKRNDTLPILILHIIGRGPLLEKEPMNLNGVTGVTFSMMNKDCEYNKISLKEASILCVSGGTVAYNWDPEDTNESGNFIGEFELNYSNGKKLSVPQIGGVEIEILDDIGIG